MRFLNDLIWILKDVVKHGKKTKEIIVGKLVDYGFKHKKHGFR